MLEVLKQALEALEKSNRFVWHYAHSKATARIAEQCDEAITSLRKAIAELESQAQPKQVNELHTCPYRENLHGDYETLCACDREATHQCAMDI